MELSVRELLAAAEKAGHDAFGICSDPELQKALENLGDGESPPHHNPLPDLDASAGIR
jgi:hypothetical protein